MFRVLSRAAGLTVALAVALAAVADDEPGKPAGEVVVTDVDGKETKLTGVRLTSGTRRLGWLGDPKATNPDARLGPQAVEVREPNSTTFARGVITLIPVASLESAKYDYEKLSVSISVKGLKDPVQGTLQYRGINTLGIAGTADGKAATFTAGAQGKAAVKSVVFPDPKPLPEGKGGVNWAVQIVHPAANNPTVKARNLKVLYQFPGGAERLAEGIPVRKGEPIPFDKNLTRFEMLANDTNTNIAAAEVETGPKTERVVAIPLMVEENGKSGTLVGLVGEVEAGYKLFPLHTIKGIVPLSRKAD
jgi:hypothetical protein